MKRYKRRYRSITKIQKNTIINSMIVFLIISMIAIGYFFLKIGSNLENNPTSIYHYTIQRQTDYEALLKPNTFYDSQTLPAGLFYASNAIDAFTIRFPYEFQADKKADIQYRYSIEGNLIGKIEEIDKEEKEVWNKSYTFLENNEKEETNIEQFLLQNEINIDYESYLNFVRAYEKEYGITIDAILKIRFVIFYDIHLTDSNLETIEDSIELEIPITDTVTEVKENSEAVTSKDISLQTQKIEIKQIIYYCISGIFILGAIVILIFGIYKNKKGRTPQTIYEREKNHILKYYGDLIVTVNSLPDISHLKTIQVNTFEDLIDVAEQNQTHIIHNESIKEEKSNFYVILHEYVYLYVLTSNDE